MGKLLPFVTMLLKIDVSCVWRNEATLYIMYRAISFCDLFVQEERKPSSRSLSGKVSHRARSINPDFIDFVRLGFLGFRRFDEIIRMTLRDFFLLPW